MIGTAGLHRIVTVSARTRRASRAGLPSAAAWALTVLLAAVLPARCSAADLKLVDEVLAVVDRTPILHSDIDLAAIVGLAGHRDEAATDEEWRDRLLDARIRLELQYHDLVSSGAVERLGLDVAGRLERLAEESGGEPALRAALAERGLGWDDLEALALRIEAARAWVEERLRPRITVTVKDVEAAYEQHVVAPFRERGETPPPITAVNAQLRTIVEEDKLNAEIARWVARCRAQRQVVRFVR